MRAWQETKNDFKISFNLCKENWKPFFLANLFALVIWLIFTLIRYFALAQNNPLPPVNPPTHLSEFDFGKIRLELFYFSTLTLIIFTFTRCQFGLSHDIMGSGDCCTEIKGLFRAFKKYWWQYLLLTIIFNLPKILLEYYTKFPKHNYNFLYSILYLVASILIIGIFPGVTRHGKIITAIKTHFKILKKDLLHVILVWVLYYLAFQLPLILIDRYVVFNRVIDPWDNRFFSISLSSFIETMFAFISNPFMALISTRIYNYNIFERKITNIVDFDEDQSRAE